MADIRCPLCSKPNPEELQVCQFCGAELKPPAGPMPPEGPSIRPGEQPVKKDTAEFEKVSLPPVDKEPIHPGEAPTKKNTAELERALPSWLRSVRSGQDNPPAGASPEPPPQKGPPPEPEKAPTPEPSSGAMPDWLAGLGLGSAEKEEEVPDWLANLRQKSTPEFVPSPGSQTQPPSAADLTQGAVPPPGPEIWRPSEAGPTQEAAPPPRPETRPPSEKQIAREPAPPPGPVEEPISEQSIAEWFSPAKGEKQPPPKQPPDAEKKPEPAPEPGLPDWVLKLQSGPSGPEEKKPATPPAVESTPAWLSNLPNIPSAPQAAPFRAEPSEGLPDWLNNLQDFGAAPGAAQPPAAPEEPIPDWLAQAAAEPEAAQAAPAEQIPEWLSSLETKAGPGSAPPSTPGGKEEPPPAPGGQTPETPDWLSKLYSDVAEASKAEAAKEEFEVASEPLPKPAPPPTPEWLSNIGPAPAKPSGTPALIIGPEEKETGEVGESAFAMEMPDWLSKLTPEQGTQAAAPGEEEKASGAIAPAELPSWVQAMRPVESVITQPRTTPQEEGKVTEERGPLAGLQGVLPAAPGLGALRKPPAYSTKLQATESQQRYAAQLEEIITDEATPHAVKAKRLISTRILRWLVAGLLILAAVVPLTTGIQIDSSSALYPPEMSAAFTLISSLPADSPVLIAFDYEPALSGELEAAASPVIDHLLLIGARLTVISTSPTGPTLAGRLLDKDLPDQNNQSGERILNLGYLAGGPAGVFYFANSPATAAPFTVDGASAWTTAQTPALPPLAGVQNLSDFKSVLVLTDSADTARVWIEQAGPLLGSTPMMMVISAQAEPMIIPYYDAGQIKGLVTGLAGGRAYGQAIQQAGPGQTYWNAFSAGLLAAEMLIGLGALWSAIAALRDRRSKSGEEA